MCVPAVTRNGFQTYLSIEKESFIVPNLNATTLCSNEGNNVRNYGSKLIFFLKEIDLNYPFFSRIHGKLDSLQFCKHFRGKKIQKICQHSSPCQYLHIEFDGMSIELAVFSKIYYRNRFSPIGQLLRKAKTLFGCYKMEMCVRGDPWMKNSSENLLKDFKFCSKLIKSYRVMDKSITERIFI